MWSHGSDIGGYGKLNNFSEYNCPLTVLMGIIYSGICRFCVCVFVFLSVFKFVLFKSGNHTAGCDYLSANALPRAAEMGRWQPRRHWQMGWAQPRWHTPNFLTSSAPNMPPTDLQVLIWVWMTFTHTTWWEKEKPIYCEEPDQDGTPTSLPLPPPNMPPTDQVLLRVLIGINNFHTNCMKIEPDKTWKTYHMKV